MLPRKAGSWAYSSLLPVGVREIGSRPSFLKPKCSQVRRKTSLFILPFGGRSPQSTPSNHQENVHLSGVFFCVCVYVRKPNFLLAYWIPITYYSCKLIIYSCKFCFAMTTQAILGTEKALLTTWSWSPFCLSITTVPLQNLAFRAQRKEKFTGRLPPEIHSINFHCYINLDEAK